MTGSKTCIILVKIILLTKSNFFRGSFTDMYVIFPISFKGPDINMPVALFLNFRFYVKLLKCISTLITDRIIN